MMIETSPVESVARLVGGPKQWQEVLMATTTTLMYTAFDAAGHEVNENCIAVAGFISRAVDWENFDSQWTARLEVEGCHISG